jgi:hypothetical protein
MSEIPLEGTLPSQMLKRLSFQFVFREKTGEASCYALEIATCDMVSTCVVACQGMISWLSRSAQYCELFQGLLLLLNLLEIIKSGSESQVNILFCSLKPQAADLCRVLDLIFTHSPPLVKPPCISTCHSLNSPFDLDVPSSASSSTQPPHALTSPSPPSSPCHRFRLHCRHQRWLMMATVFAQRRL